MNKIFGYGNYGGAIKAAIVSAILKGNMKPKMHILHFVEQLEDAVIAISDPQANIFYVQISLWVDESSIIAETRDEELPDYKEIADNSYADELRNIIEKQTSLYCKGDKD